MTNFEQKVKEMSNTERKFSRLEMKIRDMEAEVKKVQSQMNTCHKSIDHYNEIFNDIVSENTVNKKYNNKN